MIKKKMSIIFGKKIYINIGSQLVFKMHSKTQLFRYLEKKMKLNFFNYIEKFWLRREKRFNMNI